MCLTKSDAPTNQLCCSCNDEQRLAVLFNLRMLMGLAGILDCQIMQIELCLQALQDIRARLEQANPDDMTRPLRPFTRFLQSDIFDAASIGVDARCNDAGFATGRRSPWLRNGVHRFPASLVLFHDHSGFLTFCRQARPLNRVGASVWKGSIVLKKSPASLSKCLLAATRDDGQSARESSAAR